MGRPGGSCRHERSMSANPVLPAIPRPEEYPPMGGDHSWARASHELRSKLAKAIPREVLKELHRKSPARHLAIAARQFAILLAASAISWRFPEPLIWIPAALVAGWTAFNFTVLLHEVVHRAVWNGPRPRADRALGLLYAIPSGISALQFTRWHLTHHAALGAGPKGARSSGPHGGGTSGSSTPRSTWSTTTSRPCPSITCGASTSRCVRSSTRSAGSRRRTAGSSRAGSSTTEPRTPPGRSKT